MTTDAKSYSQPTIEKALEAISFDDNGLVPAIAQQHDTGEVLMMAWMNKEAVTETLQNAGFVIIPDHAPNYGAKGKNPGKLRL